MKAPTSKPYFPFIDLVKGTAIFAVLMFHTRNMIFNTPDGAFFTDLITSCYMSLFFLASGFVSASIWTRPVETRDLFAWKNYSLLLPFFVIGTLMTAWRDFTAHGYFTVNPLSSLLTQEYNGGLWFILVLTLFRAAVLFGSYLNQHLLRLSPLDLSVPFQRQITRVLPNLFLMSVIGGGWR